MSDAISKASASRGRIRSWLVWLQRSGPLRAFLGANLIAVVVILIRAQGWLQPVELVIYDELRVGWAGNQPSSRILLVGASERDIGHYNWPLRDGDLADLLERIASWKPRIIGVDIYRNFPRPPGTERLDATLARHPEIVWVFKLKDADHPEIPPPQPLVGTDREVLANTLVDPGRVVRRALLFADDGKEQYAAMGMALARGYLAPEGIRLQPGPDDSLQLGKAVIAPLNDTRGPYIRVDSRGYQTLMDYGGGAEPFPFRSVGEIMNGDEAAAVVRGRAVIVGVAAESVQDYFETPFSTGFNSAEPIYGIAIHAHLADQLIRQALDGTPSLYGLSRPLENVWIWFWALAGLGLGLAIRSTLPAVGGGFAGVLVIGGIVCVAFGKALLLPALPAVIAWLISAGLTNLLLRAASNRVRAHLRKTFEHYLPPALIAQMLKSDTPPALTISQLLEARAEASARTTLAQDIGRIRLLSKPISIGRPFPPAMASKSFNIGRPLGWLIAAAAVSAFLFRHEIAAGLSSIYEFLRTKLSALPRSSEIQLAIGLATATPDLEQQSRPDLVDVSAFAPEEGGAGSEILLQVLLHRLNDAVIAKELAQAADPKTIRRGVSTLLTEIVHGKRVDILIEGRDLTVDEPLQSIVWRGEPCACQYFVTLPATLVDRDCNLRVRVFLDDVPVGSLRFAIKVRAAPGKAARRAGIRGDTAAKYRRAFLSYATADRAEVLKRAQALRAARIEFFQDLLSIEPGERWEQRLNEEIDRCDLFLLFWSTNATRSEWVLREVERAVARQNVSVTEEPDITPIILEGPPVPQPIPDSLKHLHFNDHLRFLISALERDRPTSNLPQ
jgi:CHASE2 domain-containing sensor protein